MVYKVNNRKVYQVNKQLQNYPLKAEKM